jgi:membrane associated rhomboid family serine protease
MFVPLHDENTLKTIRFQYVTFAIIVINVIVFLFEQAGMEQAAIAGFALIPGELFPAPAAIPAAEVVSVGPAIPEMLTLLTYMFFHASWLHLGGNMLFLWVFGDNVEDAMGHLKYLVFYLLCGIIAGLVHAIIANNGLSFVAPEAGAAGGTEEVPMSQAPLIGASGAVAGVIAAYIMLHPRVRVWVLALKAIPLRISAFLALGLWILTQIVMVMIPQVGPVAWWAHIGGLITGAILILFLRRPGVRLFDRNLSPA